MSLFEYKLRYLKQFGDANGSEDKESPESSSNGHTRVYLAKLMSSQEEAPHQKNDQPKGLALMRRQQVSGRKQVIRCQETETPVEKTQARGRGAGQQENWAFFPSLVLRTATKSYS